MQANRGKVLTGVLAAAMTFSFVLSGCGNSGSNEGNANNQGSTNEATNNGNAGEKPAEKVTIEFWAQKFEDTTDAWFKKWTDEFNKSQDNVQVKLTIVPGDAWTQKLKAAQAAGKAPDVMTRNYSGIAPGAKNGEIMALNDYMDPAVFDDLYDNVKEFITVDGKYYAYPKLVEPSAVLYYRKDLFEAAGLDPEKPPVTWAEFIEYGKKLTQKGIFGASIAQTAPDLGWSSWGLQYNAAGHLPITDDWSKADVMDDKYKELLNFYATLYKEGIIPKQQLSAYADAAPFGQGKLAMTVSGSWSIGLFRNDYKDMLDKIGVAPMPSIDGDQTKPTATLGGWTLVIDGKSKKPEAAAQYIQYLLAGDPAIMIDFFKTSQFSKFSPRKSVDEAMNQDPAASADEWRKLIAEKVIPYAKAEPAYPWDISIAFATAIESAMKGESVDKALATAEKTINDFIAKSKLAGTNPQ
ncbi:ABC transporter substrate-binding protein [Paenibacillus arenilitoris]|uniref:Sugar ABC transporter substrate-binding protein n=1 Tax=Paenibacillus arenilitoris TaxID=2772299 RepID=A0A927CG01_9BACL|nr:sugar ABC transporter substrate-binding protein [Paenibacillus arenilitoris]MBD2867389.1 sugar ABC transporter substrate-binding protein [Paenibacillus arenilitoris]